MNKYPGYKNQATWVASTCLAESIKQLRTDYPEMSVLDVKTECLEFLLNHSNHAFVNQFIYVVADEIDWDFLYNDDITRLLTKV